MNNYFDDLYNDVYEYAYDTIMENKTASNRGGSNTKNVNPKIKKKIKHKKRKLLLLITAMIGAFVMLYKHLIPDYMEDWGQEGYDEIKTQLNSGSYKRGNAYSRIKTKYNVTDNTITRDYCKEMIKKLKKDKEKINELDDFKSMKALLDIEKRLKNPITKLVDSKVLTPGMKRKIGDAWDALHFEEGFIDEDFFEED